MSKKALQVQDTCGPFRVTQFVAQSVKSGVESGVESGPSPKLELYNAVHEPSGEKVTLCLLSREAGERERRRFQAETELFEALDHPNILRSLGSGEIHGLPWRAMELASGGSLQARLDSLTAPMLSALALCFERQIADALGALHEAGATHGELSPDSILLNDIDEVKLAHLGTAPLTRGGALMSVGDPKPEARRYAAPERLGGGPGDVRSDVFSAGVILRDMLEGPGAPERPRWLPDFLKALVTTATAPNPADRFSSMAAFSDAVNEAWNLLLEKNREGEELESALASLSEALNLGEAGGEKGRDPAEAAQLEGILQDIATAVRSASKG